MFHIGDYVLYKRELCVVKAKKENYHMGKDYYVLSSVNDPSLSIEVPTDNANGFLRNVMTEEEAHELIDKIPYIVPIVAEERQLESEYRTLLRSNQYEDLIKIIKTTYLRNEAKKHAGKKEAEKDASYFRKAENYLYSELAVALHMSYEDVKQYVIEQVQNKIQNMQDTSVL